MKPLLDVSTDTVGPSTMPKTRRNGWPLAAGQIAVGCERTACGPHHVMRLPGRIRVPTRR